MEMYLDFPSSPFLFKGGHTLLKVTETLKTALVPWFTIWKYLGEF